MSPMNNDIRKDYQTVLEEQTPLICNNAVENKSSITRLASLLSIGIAVFVFLAMTGQHVSHTNSISELKVSHGNSISEISELKAALANQQYELQALTVQSITLLGTALQGSSSEGDQCFADNECESGACHTKPYAFCGAKIYTANGKWCAQDENCASGYCDHNINKCKQVKGPGGGCHEPKGCLSGICYFDGSNMWTDVCK